MRNPVQDRRHSVGLALDSCPLNWWRAEMRLGPEHATTLARVLEGTAMVGVPESPAAAHGDAAVAVRVGLSKRIGEGPLWLDLAASALLRCALDGDSAAAILLHHLRVCHAVATAEPTGGVP